MNVSCKCKQKDLYFTCYKIRIELNSYSMGHNKENEFVIFFAVAPGIALRATFPESIFDSFGFFAALHFLSDY